MAGLVLNEEVAAKVMPRLLHSKSSKRINIPLSEREMDIVKLVGEGMTNKEISETLYFVYWYREKPCDKHTADIGASGSNTACYIRIEK